MELTPGEIQRRLEAIERTYLNKEVYSAEYRHLQGEIDRQEEWQEKHEATHTWLGRSIVAVALGLLVELIITLVGKL